MVQVKRPHEKKLVRVIECEVYSRIVGYYRPVQNWNNGKKTEFDERKFFGLPKEYTIQSEKKG